MNNESYKERFKVIQTWEKSIDCTCGVVKDPMPRECYPFCARKVAHNVAETALFNVIDDHLKSYIREHEAK